MNLLNISNFASPKVYISMNPKNRDSDSDDEGNSNEPNVKSSDTAVSNEDVPDIVPAQEVPTGYFISRRMSGMLMIPKHKANFVVDESALKDLNVLIAKFPDPPEDSELIPAASASSKNNSGWGFKGLLSTNFFGKS